MKFIKILALLGLTTLGANAAVLRTLPGLTGITFWEATSGVSTTQFAPAGSELTNRLAGTLGTGNRDFTGTPNEYYDVFYSNADGTFNLDGEFITIEAAYAGSSLGLNIAAVGLNVNSAVQYATSVSSYVLGVDGNAASVALAVDGNLTTSTSMGRTSGSDRMRLTVGFDAAPEVPEPSTYAMLAIGAVGMFIGRKRLGKK